MQFKDLEIGNCFRFTGDSEVMMKVASDRYIRAVREMANGRLLCQDIGTVNIVVIPCKCSLLYRILTEDERRTLEDVISKGGVDIHKSHIFETW